MKKLDEIPKKNIFEVPEGYFDQLALNIQAKTEVLRPSNPVRQWSVAVKYVLPVMLLAVGAFFVLKPKAVQDTEELLASVPTEHLIAYLHESDISEQDLIEAINFDEKDADSVNVHVHSQYLPEEFDATELKTVLENEL